jgi:hypothetical protein
MTDDDVSIDELQKAVEHTHGVPARFVEAVEVDERFKGETWGRRPLLGCVISKLTSARGRVPDSRSCGEIACLPNQEPVHSEVSRTHACSETRSRKNGKRVPDSGRGRTAGWGVWTAML